ncbi:DUF397 domain-containing protein [Nocardiopsis dassonvillei]|uniref:DUF397 domain-containing protein n=1 Tax=Nocardiopsis dassonvillei TaxID=2014 RepID=UPI00362F1E9F
MERVPRRCVLPVAPGGVNRPRQARRRGRLRHRRDRVQVRDTQNQEAATLAFPAAEWAALLRCEGPTSARMVFRAGHPSASNDDVERFA